MTHMQKYLHKACLLLNIFLSQKPLAINIEQLRVVAKALEDSPGRLLAVGFNWCFAPATTAIVKRLLGCSGSNCCLYDY